MKTCRSYLALALLSAGPAAAQLPEFGDYMPLQPGYTWTFTETSNPSNFYTWSVGQFSTFAGTCGPVLRVSPTQGR